MNYPRRPLIKKTGTVTLATALEATGGGDGFRPRYVKQLGLDEKMRLKPKKPTTKT